MEQLVIRHILLGRKMKPVMSGISNSNIFLS